MIASENGVATARLPRNIKFMVVLPARAYYRGEVRVIIATEYSKAANGGVGYAAGPTMLLLVSTLMSLAIEGVTTNHHLDRPCHS
jgi:hypothetical protein